MEAADKGHFAIVRTIVEIVGAANVQKEAYRCAVRGACTSGSLETVRFLVDAGDLRHKDHSELYRACIGGHVEIVRFLLTTWEGQYYPYELSSALRSTLATSLQDDILVELYARGALTPQSACYNLHESIKHDGGESPGRGPMRLACLRRIKAHGLVVDHHVVEMFMAHAASGADKEIVRILLAEPDGQSTILDTMMIRARSDATLARRLRQYSG